MVRGIAARPGAGRQDISGARRTGWRGLISGAGFQPAVSGKQIKNFSQLSGIN